MTTSLWPRVMTAALALTAGCTAPSSEPSNSPPSASLSPTPPPTTPPPVVIARDPVGIGRVGPLTTGQHVADIARVLGTTVEEIGGSLKHGYGCAMVQPQGPGVDDLVVLVDRKFQVVTISLDDLSKRPIEFGIQRDQPLADVVALLKRHPVEVRVEQEFPYQAARDESGAVLYVTHGGDPRDDVATLAVYFAAGKVTHVAAGLYRWLSLPAHLQVEQCRPE